MKIYSNSLYKQLIMVVLMLFLSQTALALELEENFENWNGSQYSSGIGPWVTAGATHTYLPAGGWNGSGAAKFTPCTTEGYSGVGIGTANSQRVNIRLLFYAGSTYRTGGDNKWAIFMPSPYSDGSRLIFFQHDYPGIANLQIRWNTGYAVTS